MPKKLVDCGQKAVAARVLTKEEVDFVVKRSRDLAATMRAGEAEIAAVRSMVSDGIEQLHSIRHQLGVSEPIKEAKVLYRTTNKEAAMAAMMDETQAVVETKVLKETQALQGDQSKIMAAQQVAEEALLEPEGGKKAPRPVDREAEILAAAERLNKKPEERVAVYQKMRERVLNLMREHRVEIGEIKAKKTDPSAALDQLEQERASTLADIDIEEQEAIAKSGADIVAQYGQRIEEAKTPEAKRKLEQAARIREVERRNGIQKQFAERRKAAEAHFVQQSQFLKENAERENVAARREAAHEIRREKMLSAMGELNALLKFLPAEVRGKVGGFFQLAQGGVGEKELTGFFTKRVQMIEREMERLLKADYLRQTRKLFRASQPTTAPNKVKKSKIGDAQVAADIAREAWRMTSDQTATELATIEAALTNPDLSPDEHSALLYRWSIVNAFGDFANQSAESMSSAYEWLRDTAARGRSEWGVKEEKRLTQVRGFADQIKAGLPAVSHQGLAEMEWQEQIHHFLDSFEFSHYSFAQFLEQIMPEGAAVVKRWQDASRRADDATQDFARAAGDRLTAAISEATGSRSRLAMGRSMWHLKEVQKRAINVGDESISMTRMQAIQNILSWDQPDVRTKMEKDGWTQAHIDQMAALTSDKVSQAVLEFLRDEYGKGYAIVNPIYKRMFGMDMPQNENYAPTRYHHQGMENEISLFGGPIATAGVTPSFVKKRVNHKARLRQEDALTVYWQHVAQQAHWIHYAELLREMRGVTGDPDVRTALTQKYGKAVTQLLDKWVDGLARQGGSKASELVANQWFLDGLISAKAISALGFNPRSVAMQMDSALRMTLALPMRRVVKAMLDPEFISTIPEVWKSDSIQRRVMGGASPEARYLFDRTRAKPSTFMELGRLSLMPIQLMDGFLTSFSSAVVYRDAYKEGIQQGMTEEGASAHALDSMDEAIYRYSQPVGLGSKSLQEVSGNQLTKVFMMFMSDPRLKSAIMAESIRGLATGKGDAMTHIRKLAAIQAFAMLSQVVSNLYRSFFTDDDEDEIWTWQGFALAGALAPLAGYFLVGTAGSAMMAELLGQKAWIPSRDPLIEAFQRGSRAAKHYNDILNTDDPQAMVREWDNIARSLVFLGPLGGSAAAALAVVINALKPAIGAIENAEKEEE